MRRPYHLLLIPILIMGCAVLTQATPTLPLLSTSTPELATPTSAATTPKTAAPTLLPSATPFPYSFTAVVSNLTKPVFVTQMGDQRLFIVEQAGIIKIFSDGKVATFLDIRDIVNANANERGLLGLAFHPKYKDNGFFFVYYTDAKGNLNVVRYKVSADANRADPQTRVLLFSIDHQANSNHNGGDLIFAPDGLLYIGVGDGGGQGDTRGNSQNDQSQLGKMLRINVDKQPFTPEVWAKGLRNPWRFSFDRQTGDLYIGDVGQNIWEEVDYIKAPLPNGVLNFGWNIMEGTHIYKDAKTTDTLIAPIIDYEHGANGCSVTGGYVYRGKEIPELNGTYFYGDYCSGNVWTLKQVQGKWQNDLFLKTKFSISSFGEDANGELYLINLGGAVYKLTKNK